MDGYMLLIYLEPDCLTVAVHPTSSWTWDTTNKFIKYLLRLYLGMFWMEVYSYCLDSNHISFKLNINQSIVQWSFHIVITLFSLTKLVAHPNTKNRSTGCPVEMYVIWKLILNSPNNQYMPYGYFHYGVCLKFQVLNIDDPIFYACNSDHEIGSK